MATFTVNGRTVTADKNQKLLRFLRDELRLTSVKDGCSEGACGTCTVLIDGKPTKSCVPQTDKLEGKSVLTVEGLSDFEKDVYTYAFGKAGAVQCGFCIPGMVLSAKALLDTNPAPTREEAAFAIRNNICRCTGYVKIIDAILLAAEVLRAGVIPPAPTDWSLGARVPRVDVREKVTGTGKYPDDIYLDGMLYGSAVRSAYPRARVLAIHAEEARALPGVAGVWTAADVPGKNKVGHLVKDWDTMIPVGGITHYLGDAICLVAAETPEILAQAKALVRVDYEELPMVRSPQEAMAPDAPLVHSSGNLLAHKHIQRGNPAEAIAKSKYVLTQHFSTPWTEHAFLEPECAVAYPDGDGVMILSTDQGAYDTQHETMGMLGLPAEEVKVQNQLVGGGFGGKEDVTVQHHAASSPISPSGPSR
jgi:aerobic-type carbon monoxide dehydrogenase small subunit (CoxS/CutS family)